MKHAQDLFNIRESFHKSAEALEASRTVPRIWDRDETLWSSDETAQEEISNRLGWLDIAERLLPQASELMEWAEKVAKNQIQNVFLLGMGGSALAGEVMFEILPAAKGFPKLHVLDTTDPEDVLQATETAKEGESLFIAASKSGSTVEMRSLMMHFLEHHSPSSFVAITDEGSDLERFSKERGFRRTFIGDSNIGGRFSALSYFGLVPAALCGIDVGKLLKKAVNTAPTLKYESAGANSGMQLGLFMAVNALNGRDKLRLGLPKALSSFGLWVEQLVAESSGKGGKGIVPLPFSLEESTPEREDETLIFVSIGEHRASSSIPILKTIWEDPFDLGSAFLEWEFGISVACHLLGVNTFDQPNVQDAKSRAKKALASLGKESRSSKLEITTSSNWNSEYSEAKTAFEALLGKAGPRHFFGILAFLPKETEKHLLELKEAVERRTLRPCTLQFGPRYLHSTGQLHKGGANEGIFLVLMRGSKVDVKVPGEKYTFGQLQRAQARGDFEALSDSGRYAALIDFENLEEIFSSLS